MANFYGVPGVKMISHGEWADPELIYNGYSIDYYVIEDTLYDIFKEDHDEYNATMDEYVSKETGEIVSFEKWVRDNADLVYEILDNAIDSGEIYVSKNESKKRNNHMVKKVNEKQSDRSFIDYKETDFDNPDIEYAVVVWRTDETYGKTYYFDNYKEAKEFARDMRNSDDVDDVALRKESVYGREYGKAEYSDSSPLKYNSDDEDWYEPIGRDAMGEIQYRKYGESKKIKKTDSCTAKKELYNHSNTITTQHYAFDLSNKTTDLLNKADIVADFLAMVEDIYYDMESGKDVLSNTYEKEQFIADLEIAETMYDDIYETLVECEKVIKEYLVG